MVMQPAADNRRPRFDQVLLGAVLLLLVGVFLAWERWSDLRAVEATEGDRLAVQARVVDDNLSHQLLGAYNALVGLREDLGSWDAEQVRQQASRRLRALNNAMPGVRALTVLDADGRAIASDIDGVVGRDLSGRDYFRSARTAPDPALLHASAPFIGVAGVLSMNLTVTVVDHQGRFSGVVTATLDPEYFEVVLRSAIYAADMSTQLAHADGGLMLSLPAAAMPSASSFAQPGSPFAAHRASGQASTLQRGILAPGGGARLIALRTLQGSNLPLDRPPVLVVSRDIDALLAPWRRQVLTHAVLYALLVLASVSAIAWMQRRQRQFDAAAAAQQAQHRDDAERLELALRGADLGLWDFDMASGRSVVDERWASMLGLRLDELVGDNTDWSARVHPDDRERVFALQDAHCQGLSPRFEATYRMRHRDGHWVWILDRGKVLARDAGGAPQRMVGTHMDISRRMGRREALRRSEQSLAITLQSIGDGVLATDRAGSITRMNAAAERLTGWTAAEATGRPLVEVFRICDADSRVPEQDPVTRALEDGEMVAPGENTLLLARDGREIRIAESAAPIRAVDGEVQGVVLVFSDVTAHHSAQRALRDREEQLALVTDALPSPVARVDLAGRYLFVNAAFGRWLGRPAHDLIGRTQLEVLGAERFQVLSPHVQRARAGETVHFETVVDSAHAGPLQAMVTLVPDRGADGRVRGHIALTTDVGELKRAEAESRAAQEDLRATLAAVPDLMFEVDRDGRIHSYNSGRRDLLLAPPEHFIGRTVSEVLPPDAAHTVAEALDQADRHGHSAGAQYALTQDSVQRWFELSVARKRAVDGRLPRFIALARDVTERNQAEAERQALERQLREAHKMESIGTLAGGIAHDFNNILAAILGNVALAQQDLAPGHAALTSLEQIQRVSLRARTLVQQILAFSRRQPHALATLELRPVVEDALALLRATLPAGVRLKTRFASAALPVECDATQIEQVLMNLCTNAWHALPARHGRIEIGLDAVQLDADAARAAGEIAPGGHAHLWVTDNGSGMDGSTLARIFDPFFTTKPVGQGTGLGLSVVHGIVRAHRGGITVDSTPGAGSTFHLYLPLATGTAVHETPLPPPKAAAVPAPVTVTAAGAGQRVLYVDDDEVMLLMVERLLERAGFVVGCCVDAAQALARVQAEPEAIDIVVTDYNMPEMSGIELARALLRVRPGLPIVISTGHVTELLRAQATELGVRTVMNKESTFDELAPLLQAMLAAVPARA